MNKPILIEITIWCIILTVIFCAGIFGYSKIFVEPNIYNIEFRDIDGITKGSPVRFMGMNVGYVKKLKPKDKSVIVQIVVTSKNMKIPNGTIARVEFYGLGGSKSIELMPAQETGGEGIISANTLRLHDMVVKSEDLVEILEVIEKYIKGINPPAAQRALERMAEFKDEKIKNMGSDFSNFKTDIIQKAENIRQKQAEMNKKIDSVNDAVDKINKFIKK
ncbi:MCE family protein [bacterium]|nr:MCE family protein [bacterium]